MLGVFLGSALGSARCGRLLTVFEEIFEVEYKCSYCADNILTLVKAAKHAKLNLGGARVIVIVGDAQFTLLPRAARVAGSEWIYHVVLEVDGRIFDFDYRNVPTSIPVQEYFETMFATKSHLLRRIPVWSYLKDGGTERVSEIVHSITNGDRAGAISIEHYLRSRSSFSMK